MARYWSRTAWKPTVSSCSASAVCARPTNVRRSWTQRRNPQGRPARPGVFHRPDQQPPHPPCLPERRAALRRLVRGPRHRSAHRRAGLPRRRLHQGSASTGGYNFTIAEDRDDENDILALVERASRPEQYKQRRQAIIQSYVDAVREARQSGAQLLHSHFGPDDFDLVLDLYPEALERWLEGMNPPTNEFRRRVRLAEGFFVGLCEAVLKRDPSRGIPLWRALRGCLVTRFIGSTGIDRMQYAPFAAPDGSEADALLDDLYALDEARTDEDLLDIVVAARASNRVDWLRRMVSLDENSPCPAHRRRAAYIRPLLARPDIAGDAAWPSAEPVGGYREIRDHSWIMGQREAFAAHWLRKFAEADTSEAAHASWLLFMACSDRRVRTWMSEDYARYAGNGRPIEAQKQRFVEQQRHRLKRAITENEKSLKKHFTGQRITEALLPWRAG